MVPLDVTSMHAPAVHASWPISVCRNLFNKSNSFLGAVQAQHVFIQRFIDYQCPPWLIRQLQLVNGHRSIRVRKPVQLETVIWFPVAFHSAWNAAISRALAEFISSPTFSLLGIAFSDSKCFVDGYTVKTAWKNGAAHLTSRVHAIYEKTLSPPP